MRANMSEPSTGPPQYNVDPQPTADGLRRRALPTLAVVLATPLLIGLGLWQLDRAQEKRELIAAFERGSGPALSLDERLARGVDAALYQPVYLDGSYLGANQFLLDARIIGEGRIGYDVLTPFALAGGRGIVLVDRGFVLQDANRRPRAELAVDGTERRVHGRIARLPRAGVKLGPASESASQDWPRVMLYPERAELEAALGRPVLEPIVLLDADEPDGYVREWRVTDMSPERHVAYALQWFAFAVTLVVIYGLLQFRRRRPAS
jgi:surfeit locus 1 family protein